MASKTEIDPLDIRWKQRFENYSKAHSRLTEAVELANERELSDLKKQGLIQAFEFSHELAWNVLANFYKHQGETSIQDSRDATRLAANRGLIPDGDPWMQIIQIRKKPLILITRILPKKSPITLLMAIFRNFLSFIKSSPKNFKGRPLDSRARKLKAFVPS